MAERSLILLKPDAVERRLIGEIIARFERRGLRIAAMKMIRFDRELARRHYAPHVDQYFYARLEKFITSGPAVAMVVEGEGVIDLVRAMMGKTDPSEAAPGTIRGDLATRPPANLVHGSDSAESAAREIPIFFPDDEIL